jgi:hypothetical protein
VETGLPNEGQRPLIHFFTRRRATSAARPRPSMRRKARGTTDPFLVRYTPALLRRGRLTGIRPITHSTRYA